MHLTFPTGYDGLVPQDGPVNIWLPAKNPPTEAQIWRNAQGVIHVEGDSDLKEWFGEVEGSLVHIVFQEPYLWTIHGP